MTTDLLTKLTPADPHSVRAWVVKITAVDTPSGTCTMDPNDGDLVPEVPYWGTAPAIGSVQVALLFDGLLGVVSTGSGSGGSVSVANGLSGSGQSADPIKVMTSNTWGVDWLAKSGNDPIAGRGIFVDSAGQLRSRPTEVDAVANTLTGTSLPGDWPNGMFNVQVTGATSSTWPNAVSGMVVNYRRAGEADTSAVNHQWFYETRASSSTYAVHYRAASGNPSVWGPWVDVISPDSGWVNITINSGFAADNVRPQVRIKDGVVYPRGGWSNTGVTAINTGYTVGNVPAGYRPAVNTIGRCGTNTGLASAGLVVAPNGDVVIRTGPNLGTYYLFGGQSWLTD